MRRIRGLYNSMVILLLQSFLLLLSCGGSEASYIVTSGGGADSRMELLRWDVHSDFGGGEHGDTLLFSGRKSMLRSTISAGLKVCRC